MSTDRTLQSIADVLAANEQHIVPRDPNLPEPHWRDITGLPEPRPVPSPEDRMRDARQPGPTFATYLDRHDRDQLDARAATDEGERDDALDDRDQARAEAANLRRELDKANAGRQKLQEQLDTMTQVAQGNKRHVAYLTATLNAVQKVVDNYRELNGRVAPLSELDEALNTPQPPSSVPPRRAQEQPTETPEQPSSCPVRVWDGPYSYRCSQGALVGVCATHGRFRPTAEARP